MSTQFVKEKSPTHAPMHKEGGFTLLGAVFIAALVVGFGALGILGMTKNASTTVYGENAANQARTAALMGINALAQYAQQQYATSGYNGLAQIPVGTAVVKSMGAQGNAPLSNVQAAVIANTYYNPPIISVGVGGINLTAGTGSPNHHAAIFIQSTGRAGPYAETARAVLTLQENNAAGTFVPMPYDIFAREGATFNGGTSMAGATTIGVGLTAAINGGATIGELDAYSVALNGTVKFSSIRAESQFTSNGNNQGAIQLGDQVIGGLPKSGNGLTYQLLSAQATSQLHQDLMQTPAISAKVLQDLGYAGLQFLDQGNGNETGTISVTSTEAQLLNQSLPWGTLPILAGEWPLQPPPSTGSTALQTQQIASLETAICGNDTCLSYTSGTVDGTWSINGGFSPNFTAFLYVQGGLSVNGNTGSATAPLYLTIAANNAVSFNGGAYLKPYASQPGLCSSLSDDPVCSGGSPNQGLLGLSIVSGSSTGSYLGSGITFNGNSGIYGSIASNGDITINGSSKINGRIVTNANLTMNGTVGTLANGAQNANFGGGSPKVNPPIMAIGWLRWM